VYKMYSLKKNKIQEENGNMSAFIVKYE